jgi:hypothetical protein
VPLVTDPKAVLSVIHPSPRVGATAPRAATRRPRVSRRTGVALLALALVSTLAATAPAGAAPVPAGPTVAAGEGLSAADALALDRPLETPIFASGTQLSEPVASAPLATGGVTHRATENGIVASGAASTFEVTYESGFDASPEAKISFQAAVDVWASTVVSSMPIRVQAKFGTTSCSGSSFGPSTLGSAGPGGLRRNFAGAPLTGVWYPRGLADSLAGSDLDPGSPDICAAFNSNFSNWYFGTSGAPGLKYDFESVVLHELGHGLGFVGSMSLASPTTADCCFTSQGSLAGPVIYDTKTFNGATAMTSIARPSATLLTALQSNNVFFRGPAASAAAGSADGAKLYAPAAFQPGSSYAHLDEATYGPFSGNALMTPIIEQNEVEHSPGPITIGIFQDMGWGVSATSPGPPTSPVAVAGNTTATVSWVAPVDDGGATITNYTVTSVPDNKTCTWSVGPLTCTVTGLTNGTSYTFTVRAQNVAGQGPASGASNAVVPVAPPTTPSAPLNPLASAGSGNATVTWAPPASTGGAAITQYVVTSSPSGLTCTWTSGPLSCVVNGLTNGTPYRFSVTAKNSVGTGPASVLSNQVSPGSATPPGAPTSPTATAGKQQATVTWVAPAPNGGPAINSYVVVAAPGNQTCTAVSGTFTCTVTGLTAGTSYTFTVRATNDAGPGPASVATSPPVVPWSGSFFHSLDPTRLLDSRGTTGGFNGPLGAGVANTKSLTVTGGSNAVPSTATAVVLNVTATGGTANSFMTVFPNGESVPSASNLNFAAGETIPNLVTVKVGAQGKVSFFNAVGAVHVVADIVGYYDDGMVTGDRFTAIDPTRVLDSRVGPGFLGKVNAGAANTKSLKVRGAGTSLPGTATAVVVNVTATGGTTGSFLSVFPAGTSVPTASNLNFGAGQTIPNLVIVKIGAGDSISFFNAVGAVDVIADVVGFFDPTAGAYFHAVSPNRILDSRGALGGFNGPVTANTPKVLFVGGANSVPGDATAAVMNTTVTGGTNASFLTLFPTGGLPPNVSNLNFAPGQTIPNLVTVKLGSFGRVSFANAVGAVNTIADLVGYYGPI